MQSCCKAIRMIALLTSVESLAIAEVAIPRWQTHDFHFKSTAAHENPFLVDFSAEVAGPKGLRFAQLGYYDGNGTWTIRLGPNAPGAWSIRTVSSDPQLDGHVIDDIVCAPQVNPKIHGGLLVDTKHPHHFVREDDARFFYSGYECDWLWAIDLAAQDPRLPQTTALLDKVAAHGFNVVFMNIYAHQGFGHQQPDFGPPAMYAWTGTNERPDHSKLNVRFWQHYDRVIRAMWERGLDAHIMIKVYNKKVNWPTPASQEDDLYFKYAIARYAPFCNVHWDFSKESNKERDLDYKLGRMAFIRRFDPYRRLLTTHTDQENYSRYFGVLDYRTDQNHGDVYSTALRQRSAEPWPVVNSEYGYECGLNGIADRTYEGGAQDALTLFKRAWEVYMAGGYGAYYYTYTAWDIIRVNDTPPGYGYYENLAGLFDRTGFWLMEPDDSLVSAGHCLANPGVEYVVYQPDVRPFTLKLEKADGPLTTEWFNPLTGATAPTQDVHRGLHNFVPPSNWANGPVVLHVGKKPAEEHVFHNTFRRPLPTNDGLRK